MSKIPQAYRDSVLLHTTVLTSWSSCKWYTLALKAYLNSHPLENTFPEVPNQVTDFPPWVSHSIWLYVNYRHPFYCLFVYMSLFPTKLKATLNPKLHLTHFYFPKGPYSMLNKWMSKQILQIISVYQGRTLLTSISYLWEGRNIGDLCGILQVLTPSYHTWGSITLLMSHWNFDFLSLSLEIWRNSPPVFLWLLRIVDFYPM